MSETMSTAEISDEIDRVRAELGETVAALAAKTDVKSRLAGTTARALGHLKRNAVPWVLGACAVILAVTATKILGRR